jgi:hypothetical protein
MGVSVFLKGCQTMVSVSTPGVSFVMIADRTFPEVASSTIAAFCGRFPQLTNGSCLLKVDRGFGRSAIL